MMELVTYVPEDYLEAVKEALFAAGGGFYGNYDKCCWCTLGTGQFRALEGSSPFIGRENEVEYVKEYRLEMIVPEDKVKAVVAALKDAHPYEVPAYHIFPILAE